MRAVNPFPLSLEFIFNLILTNGQLDKDGEEEEDGLVGGGQVDPAVQADQEDQLHQQGGVHDGVGETGTKPDNSINTKRIVCAKMANLIRAQEVWLGARV